MDHEIKICMGSSCFARGNEKNLEIIERFLSENNLMASVDVIGSRCEDCCSIGPNIIIDDISYNNIQNGYLIDLLSDIFSSGHIGKKGAIQLWIIVSPFLLSLLNARIVINV